MKVGDTTKKSRSFDTYGDRKSVMSGDGEKRIMKEKKPSIFGDTDKVKASILKATQKSVK
jgi:hypothetical protein